MTTQTPENITISLQNVVEALKNKTEVSNDVKNTVMSFQSALVSENADEAAMFFVEPGYSDNIREGPIPIERFVNVVCNDNVADFIYCLENTDFTVKEVLPNIAELARKKILTYLCRVKKHKEIIVEEISKITVDMIIKSEQPREDVPLPKTKEQSDNDYTMWFISGILTATSEPITNQAVDCFILYLMLGLDIDSAKEIIESEIKGNESPREYFIPLPEYHEKNKEVLKSALLMKRKGKMPIHM